MQRQIRHSAVSLLFLLLAGSCNYGGYYAVTAEFDKVDGLYKKARVEISGLEVGYVKDIQLVDNKIKVNICIQKDTKVSDKAIFAIRSADVLGTKFIEIQDTIASENYLADGATTQGIYDGTTTRLIPYNMDSFVQNIAKPILDSLGYDVIPKQKK